jgi:tetratricopeptide (TPR) repeat protein
MRRVMLRYFDEMRAVLERHGGTVEKFIGDAVMAVFGIPRVHEDDALRAVRAAGEMRKRLAELNLELEARWGVRLEARIGINTGEVVTGEGQTMATGDAVNVAARLQQAAEPGDILLGKETYALVSSAVEAGPLESFAVRGRRAEVHTWRLEDVRSSAEQVFRRLGSPLVGREPEQEALHAVYRQTLEEQSCRLVTVVGPAGIGKTRLAQEVAAHLFGATVAVGRCLPYGDGITFFPIVEIVRTLAGVSADDPPARVQARVSALAGGDEALATRILDLLGLAGDTRADEWFWALRRLFESHARERPLVLVLEDVHWAEPTLLDLVEYLVGWSRGAPILLLCLARAELFETRTTWSGERIALDPLDESEVAALLTNVLGSAALETRAARRISAAAEGNPLFVEELVRMLVDDGVLHRVDGVWTGPQDLDSLAIPPTINALLSARLDRLDPEERAVLQAAAVIGKEFWWTAVTALAAEELRPRVGMHLHALVRKRLIFPAESSAFAREDSFRFGHILVRDAAYAAMSKEQRTELHERFASWLEERGAYSEISGHHLEQAYLTRVELGIVDEETARLALRAGRQLSAAARQAIARDDTHAAQSLLTRAIALLPEDEPERLRLLANLGDVLARAGEFARAGEVFTDLLERAVETGDRGLELMALIQLQFVRYFTEPEGSLDEIRRLTDWVIPELEELDDHAGLAKAWWLESSVHTNACRWGARAEALQRALDHAQRAGDKQQQTTLTAQIALTLVYGPTPVDEAIARCSEFYAAAAGDRALEAGCLSALATLHAMSGDIDQARDECAQARAIYDELGLKHRRAARSLADATVEMLAGNPDGAERELRAGYDTLTAMGDQGVRSTLASFLGEALYAQGRFEEAEELSRVAECATAADDIVTQVMWRTVRAKVSARSGQFPEAERLAREAVELAESTDFPDLRAGSAMALAEVLTRAGRAAEAEPLALRARAIHEEKGNTVAALATRSLLGAAAG